MKNNRNKKKQCPKHIVKKEYTAPQNKIKKR